MCVVADGVVVADVVVVDNIVVVHRKNSCLPDMIVVVESKDLLDD